MRIGACVKQVPGAGTVWALEGNGFRLDRSGAAILDPADAWAVEVALRIRETCDGELVVITMGPPGAVEAIRAALAMGAGSAVQVTDAALEGADAVATARVLAAVARREDLDLLITGAESSDGSTGVVPAAVAELLGVPALTHALAGSVAISPDGARLTATRRLEHGDETVETALPAVVSVSAAGGALRYATLAGILRAGSLPVETLLLPDLELAGLPPRTGGHAVVDATPAPPRGEPDLHQDRGDSGRLIARFLASRHLL